MRLRSRWRVRIEAALFDSVVMEGARVYPLETGGVLMGYVDRRAAAVVVTHVVGPGPGAVHERTAFSPDQEWHESEVARLYAESGRTCTYLGDWHTHPDGQPVLSSADRATLRTIARSPEARCQRPLILIAAIEASGRVDVRAYQRRRFGVRECRVELAWG